jgi:GDP-L-fucose synthase
MERKRLLWLMPKTVQAKIFEESGKMMNDDFGRILICGASGLIGSNLTRRLVAEGRRVRAVYHTRPPTWDTGTAEVVQADLRDAAACAQVCEGIDTVFLCAAHTSGAAVIREEPLSHVTPNVLINTLMLHAAHAQGVKRFVFISTSCVYPDTGTRPAHEDEVLDGPPHPVYFAVGWMKRYAEILCRTYATHITPAMRTVVVRPANIYGPYDKFSWRTSHVTAAQIRKVFERQPVINVWGSGQDIRDVIYIDDFLDGLVRAASVDQEYLEVNIASGTGVSVTEILTTAMAVENHTAEIEFDLSKPTTIPARLFDTERAKSLLGFEAKTSLEDGLRRTFNWLRHTPPQIWDR